MDRPLDPKFEFSISGPNFELYHESDLFEYQKITFQNDFIVFLVHPLSNNMTILNIEKSIAPAPFMILTSNLYQSTVFLKVFFYGVLKSGVHI
jgi:hypothetical protein